MRRVAFGTGVCVDFVVAIGPCSRSPALNSIVYSVCRPPGATRSFVYARPRMTLHAKAAELVHGLGSLLCGIEVPTGGATRVLPGVGSAVEGILVNMVKRRAADGHIILSSPSASPLVRSDRRNILFIGRGHPRPFQERHTVSLIGIEGRAHSMRVMARRAETSDGPHDRSGRIRRQR